MDTRHHGAQTSPFYSVMPTVVTLQDHWSDMDYEGITSDASVSLSFQVLLGDVDGFAAILVLPAVIETLERIDSTWQHQVDNAQAESDAYSRYLKAKPDDAFATVAATMQKSVQKQQESDCLVNVKIVRIMNLRANRLRLGIYMFSLAETELYRLRFEGLSTTVQRESGINGNPIRSFDAVLQGIRLYRHTIRKSLLVEGKPPPSLDEWHHEISRSQKSMKVIALPTTVS